MIKSCISCGRTITQIKKFIQIAPCVLNSYDFSKDEILHMEMSEVFNEDYWDMVLTGYIETQEIDILECVNYEITIINDKALISGRMMGTTSIEGYQYNPVRDRGESRHTYIGGGDAEFEFDFSFTIMKDKNPSDLELSHLEII